MKYTAYRFDGFYLDPVRRLLLNRDRQPIPLRPRAFDTLHCLVERPGTLLERQELLRAVWPKVVVHENNLDQAISAVRRALGETRGEHRFVVTVPGRGYRFVARVETIPASEEEPCSRATEDVAAAQRGPAAQQPRPAAATGAPADGSRERPLPTELASALPQADQTTAGFATATRLEARPERVPAGESRNFWPYITGDGFEAKPERVPAGESARTEARAAGSPAPARADRTAAARRPYWTLGAATAAVATIAVAALAPGLRQVQEPVSDLPRLDATPLSVERGGHRSAVWSPDGNAVAFAARATMSEPFQLYVRTMDSPVASPVTPLDRTAVLKRWTPAGELLYLDGSGLWAVPPGGAPRQLIERIDIPWYYHSDAGTDVTHDGSTIAVLGHGEDGLFGVWTAVLPDGQLEKYEPAPFAARRIVNRPFLRFSPDGRQLLLIRNIGEGEQAWLLPFPPDASRPPRPVLESLRTVKGTPHFSWLPDNRRIVMSAATEGRRELYVADTQSGELRPLSRGERDRMIPVVSPDGDRLVFTDGAPDFDIVTLDIATAVAAPLIASRRAEVMPAWAAGAEALVYVADRSGAMEIWLHQPGRPDRPLVTARSFPTATRWFMAPALSPDGTRVIYTRVEEAGLGPARLWMSAVDGGAPKLVTNQEGFEGAGSWSPDGAWYVYTTYEQNGWSKLRKVKTTGHAEPETLLEIIQSTVHIPAWSPDGDWILIADHGMKLVSSDGETTRDLGIENAVCAFAQIEKLLYCIIMHREDGRYPFVAIDFEGNVIRTIGSVPREHLPDSPLLPGVRLTPTPDGSGVTYAIGHASQDLWLMEGLSKFLEK